jgi:hypothetical protein
MPSNKTEKYSFLLELINKAKEENKSFVTNIN